MQFRKRRDAAEEERHEASGCALARRRVTRRNHENSTKLHLWSGLWVGSSELHSGFLLIGKKCRGEEWWRFHSTPQPRHQRSQLPSKKFKLLRNWQNVLSKSCRVGGGGGVFWGGISYVPRCNGDFIYLHACEICMYVYCTDSYFVISERFLDSVAFSPQANYTDRATTACRRS
jgi:hypothetical protein